MRIFLKYGISPLIPLFFLFCVAITLFNYLPIFNGRPLFDLFPILSENHISNFTDRGNINIIGTIVSNPEEFNNHNNQSQIIDKAHPSILDNSSDNKKPQSSDRRVRFELSVENIIEIESGAEKKVRVPPIAQNEDSEKFHKNVSDVDIVEHKVEGKVQMNIYNPIVQYNKGDTIQFEGNIKSLRNFNNQGGFDYVRYMRNKGLWGRVNISGKHITLYNLQKTHSNNSHSIFNLENFKYALHKVVNLYSVFNNFRDAFTAHVFNNITDKDSASILCALTTGNKDFISDQLKADFARTGGSHILAISGLHLSIVATLFFYLFNLLLSLSSTILIRGWSKKVAALLTLLPIIAYSVLSGLSDATERAMIMVTIFMIAAVVERETDTFNSLAAAGIIILIIDPLSIFTVSFQLSFSAVFFILMGLSLSKEYKFEITEKLNRLNGKTENRFNFLIQNRFLKVFVGFIFISSCATLGTQILVMHYFNILSFSSLFTNIILIPSIGFVALPLGLVALFCYPFSVEISGFLIKCADFIVTHSIELIRAIAKFPGSYTETFTPDIVEIFCYYLSLFFLFVAAKSWHKVLIARKMSQEETIEQKKLTKKREVMVQTLFFKVSVFGVIVSSLILLIHEGVWINKRYFNKTLSVTVLDVGQGNSALIEIPKGKTILVDGGGFTSISNFDTGANIIAPFLRQKKIMTLDAVILTHPDADHLNGLVYIVEHFKVKRFIKNCDEQNSSVYKNLIANIKKSGADLLIIDDNIEGKISPSSINIGNVDIYFLHPLKPCSVKERDENKDNINNNSIVFKLVFGQTSILFPGDITAKAEVEIVDKYKNELTKDIKHKDINYLKSDILIAPHHGSASSSSDFFLNKVDPECIVISCGWKNRFGFPRSDVLKRYRKRGVEIFRTDLNGAVTLYSDGIGWKIRSFL